jgi:hypothetical protein
MFEKEAEEYREEWQSKGYYFVSQEMEQIELDDIVDATFKDGAEFGYNKANEWHKLDWKKDYPKLDRLVRVRTKCKEEYICETYAYIPTEDEIGYGTVLTQFEQLDGDWVDDNDIEYWCYIEPFKESE